MIRLIFYLFICSLTQPLAATPCTPLKKGAIEQQIPPFFSLLDGNSTLTKAKVIALGDVHQSPFNAAAIVDFVNQYGRKGDIVLVEGLGQMKTITADKTPFIGIKSELKLLGWDNIEALRDSHFMVKRLLRLNQEIEVEKDPVRHDQLVEKFEVMSRIHDKTSIQKRNQSLLETLELVQSEITGEQRVFVIAGSRHFSADPVLMEGLAGFPYLCLMPRYSPTGDLGATESYFN